MTSRSVPRLHPVRLALYADAAFELIVAVLLAVLPSTWADLFNVEEAVIWAVAGAFLLAAGGIGLVAALQIESREVVWGLAAANIAGGLLLWLLFVWMRGDFDPGARWANAAVADTLILIGLLEVVALRESPPREA